MGKLRYTLLKSIVLVAISGFILFCGSSCNKAPNGGIPIYLHIDSPTVTYNSYFGANSYSIPDVWATSGAANLGAYEMPVNIPILESGNVPMAISAGIWDNGIVSAPVQYPFYAPDTFTIYNAIPGHIYHHHPVYYYFPYTQVALNADFEIKNYFTNVTLLPVSAGSPSYLGLRCGGIIVPASADTITAIQTVAVPIVTNGRQAYVELDYLANSPNVFCDVGILGTITSGSAITEQQPFDKVDLYPRGYWNKIYLNFNNEIGTFSSGTGNGSDSTASFQVYFTVTHQAGTQDTMYIDNVKILYFH